MSISAMGTRGEEAPFGAGPGDRFDADLEVHERFAVVCCRGTLDAATAPLLVAVVGEAVGSAPRVRVDVTELRVDDATGAKALALLQRDARASGVELHWQGLAPDHLRGIASVRYRARPVLAARTRLGELPKTLAHVVANRRPHA